MAPSPTPPTRIFARFPYVPPMALVGVGAGTAYAAIRWAGIPTFKLLLTTLPAGPRLPYTAAFLAAGAAGVVFAVTFWLASSFLNANATPRT